MDLSKAFDTLNHKLLLRKSNVFNFDANALTLIQSYFSNRNQKIKKMIGLANGKKSQQTCFKDLYLGPYFSTFLFMILFFLLKLLHFETAEMAILCILQTKSLIL